MSDTLILIIVSLVCFVVCSILLYIAIKGTANGSNPNPWDSLAHLFGKHSGHTKEEEVGIAIVYTCEMCGCTWMYNPYMR
jgi:hypothetical protein